MSRIYKILFDNGSGKTEMFAIKPLLGRFDDFKDEIFIRMPELKNKSLKFYYEDVDGDKITIFNTNDFAIFHEQSISKVFVEVQKQAGSVNFAPISAPWPTLSAAQVFTSNLTAAAAKPGTSILKKLPSSASADDIRRYLHSGVVCDNCDKEIRGYRYKCLECADYDLCMECEPSNHSQHLLLRIANPNDAEICYRAKLGKRFGRHRRSESLCSKPTEERHHEKKGHHDKKAHNKRNAPCSRPAIFADVVSDILKSVVGTGADGKSGEASSSNENRKATSVQERENVQNAKTPKTSSKATPFQEPMPSIQRKFSSCRNPNGSPNSQLTTHIDTLSNMAQHFATMMDPFATYIKESTANIASEKFPTAAPPLGERVRGILKTLTPDNIDSVFEQFKALNIDEKEQITSIVTILFEKANNEPHLSAEIAKLSQKLSECEEFFDAFGASIFKTELQNSNHFSTFCYDYTNKRMRTHGKVGALRFVGELYHLNLYPATSFRMMIDEFSKNPTNANLEALCELLTMVGQKIENDEVGYNANLMSIFQKLELISDGKNQSKLNKVSSRVRSMLSDLIELRKNGWVQRSEPMDGVNTTEETEKPQEPQTSAMIVDCTDDEVENVDRLNRASSESSSDGSQSEKSNRGDSPSREWAFVDVNEIDDVAQASASAQASSSTNDGILAASTQNDGTLPAKENGTLQTDSLIDLTSYGSLIQKLISAPDGILAAKKTGTLPKQLSKQSQNANPVTDEPSLDYSELSRRLNDHIIGEKTAESIEEKLDAARSAATRMGAYLKASESQVQPVESVPKVNPLESSAPLKDPRIAQAVNTMTAMGFSNEGGWLNQLLEAVNGDITSAIELMTPHK